MISPPRRRLLIDRGAAAALAVVVAVVGFVVYRSSDIRNADLVTGPSSAVPSPTAAAPTTLQPAWTAVTDPALSAVVSPSGVVVTTDQHTVTARDALTGAVRWHYTRSNRTLCAVGGDVKPDAMDASDVVPGVATVFAENGYCSQVMTFDPVTGVRGRVRTSPNQIGGSLVFGSSYAGWLGPTRLEVWRYDLVRTIQYGDQANPPKSGESRLGCTFTDLALATTQFATVEHCLAEGPHARVVLNFDDPGGVDGHPSGWDTFQHSPRVDIDTGAAAARLLGVTADRVAVLVSGPTPAVVVYDATGKQTSRTPVQIPASDIVAADAVSRPAQVTRAVQAPTERYSLVGSHLLAVSTATVTVPQPSTALPPTSTTTTSSSSITGALGPGSTSGPTTVSVTDLQLDWVAAGALGLPATVGSSALVPTAKGLAVVDSARGPGALGLTGARVVPVDRGHYAGPVDATAVGPMIVEVRGGTVVALSGKG